MLLTVTKSRACRAFRQERTYTFLLLNECLLRSTKPQGLKQRGESVWIKIDYRTPVDIFIQIPFTPLIPNWIPVHKPPQLGIVIPGPWNPTNTIHVSRACFPRRNPHENAGGTVAWSGEDSATVSVPACARARVRPVACQRSAPDYTPQDRGWEAFGSQRLRSIGGVCSILGVTRVIVGTGRMSLGMHLLQTLDRDVREICVVLSFLCPSSIWKACS